MYWRRSFYHKYLKNRVTALPEEKKRFGDTVCNIKRKEANVRLSFALTVMDLKPLDEH